METLKRKRIFYFSDDKSEIIGANLAGLPISARPGHSVFAYEELLEKVSALNFYNPSLQLYFRGQTKDYFNYTEEGKPIRSNLYPGILRSLPVKTSLRRATIEKRVKSLELADSLLKDRLAIGYIHRHTLVRWAILQHYEVCQTPLLDITSSLHIALSFAVSGGSNEGFLYVFGFPHQTGPVSVSLESMTQNVDLAKICPPEASRPHFQSALLVADYPTALYTTDLIQRAPRVEANFACRLLTKFHLKNLNEWVGSKFAPAPTEILYPNDRDNLYPILEEIKGIIAQQ